MSGLKGNYFLTTEYFYPSALNIFSTKWGHYQGISNIGEIFILLNALAIYANSSISAPINILTFISGLSRSRISRGFSIEGLPRYQSWFQSRDRSLSSSTSTLTYWSSSKWQNHLQIINTIRCQQSHKAGHTQTVR